MNDSASSSVSLFHQSAAELLAMLRSHRAYRYSFVESPTGHVALHESFADQIREPAGILGLRVVASGVLPGCLIIQHPSGDLRAGEIVLRGLTKDEAIRRCDEANAGEGLYLHLRN